MFQHLFSALFIFIMSLFLLIVLLFCCTFSKAAVTTGTLLQSVAIFEQTETTVKDNSGSSGTGSDIKFTNFYFPYLVAADDVMVAIVGGNRTEKTDNSNNIDILAKYIEIEKADEWLKKSIGKDSNNGWTTQIAVKETQQINCLKISLAAARGKNIYVLIVNYTAQISGGSLTTDASIWNFKLFVGTVDKTQANQKQITWKEEETLQFKKTIEEFKDRFKKLDDTTIINGFVLLPEDESIVFALQFNNNKGIKKKNFAFIQLWNNKLTVKFAQVDSVNGDCSFNLFTWKKKIMMLKVCNNKKTIQELLESKEKWEGTDESISRVLHHIKNNNYFITTSINNNDVLLFTQQKKDFSSTEGKENFCIDLWITDGTRSYDVGPIVTSNEEVVIDSILYTKNKLFFLHHKKKEQKEIKSVFFTNLQEQLKNINDALNAWNSNKNAIEELCGDTTSLSSICITNGLVGFLSTNVKENIKWQDELLYTNATITEVAQFENGLKFDGVGKGAVWPVGKSADDQPYNFADPGFTLVAIVTVDNVAQENLKYNSILGVGIDGESNTIGLWCNDKKKWTVGKGEDQTKLKSTNENCEVGSTYQVVLILGQDEKLDVYINGTQLKSLITEDIKIKKTNNITYFYFGADKEKNNIETHVTIGKVLLYNRPFNKDEIVGQKATKEIKPVNSGQENNEENTLQQQSTADNPDITKEGVKGGGGGGEMTTDTVNKEVVPSSTQQRESAVGNNINIIVNVVMCSVLYSLLERWVYYVLLI